MRLFYFLFFETARQSHRNMLFLGMLDPLMIFHGLDALQLTQEKEKSSVHSTGCFNKILYITIAKVIYYIGAVHNNYCQHFHL